MLGESGIDFMESLVRKGCKQRRFALTSGAFSAADLTRAQNLGCKLLTKPLKMTEVVAWVEAAERTMPADRILYDWA